MTLLQVSSGQNPTAGIPGSLLRLSPSYIGLPYMRDGGGGSSETGLRGRWHIIPLYKLIKVLGSMK